MVQVPEATADIVSPLDETQLWKVAIGIKKGGPFSKAKLKQLVDNEKLPADAFVRDQDGAADWSEVQTCGWLFDFPERRAVRYCPECDCRVIISGTSPDKP